MQLSFTVDVEEWFHTNWFDVDEVINKYYFGQEPESNVLKTTEKLVNLFNNNEVKGTFFVLGETANKYPELIELLESSPNEIACHGFYHNNNNSLVEFRRDLQKFKKEIFFDSKGFRFPNFGYSKEKLEILNDEGFKYDSSIVPCFKIPGWYGKPDSSIKPHYLELNNGKQILEFPISVLPGLRLPGGGGWFLRNLGFIWTKLIIQSSLKNTGHATIYIHPWEISDCNPNFDIIPFHVFRNTGSKTLKNLKKLINAFSETQLISLSERKLTK